jgi:hypothetical protein
MFGVTEWNAFFSEIEAEERARQRCPRDCRRPG